MLSGQDYFQQRVDHTIAVSLDDVGHMLHGQGSFIYANNSPSTLDTLWIHLWPNAYRDKSSALCEQMVRTGDLSLHFAKEEDRGWIDSLDFTADGENVVWGYHPEHADIGWVALQKPLVPGASTTIATPFRVKIPDGKFSRLGHTGQAYYVTQWYPKPAVFDAQGWHAMPYLTLGEFYSEFGSFDVTITLPENYVVGATGMLTGSPEESAFMNERADLPVDAEASNTFPPSSSSTKTIRFTQDQVHDFAWFADKRFIVRKSEVALPNSGRTVTTWALFTPKNAKLWADAVSYVNESVRLYSQWVGDYPYDACTALDGTISAGGGMEYPMITIIGNMSSVESLDNVIAHEVGHNWFYGILGSNERDHAWMDEGMNSFVELRYMRERYPSSGMGIQIPFLTRSTAGRSDGHHLQSELGYRLNARRNLDQPPCLHANEFTEINYGTMVYMKTALIMDHLMAYLGEETMDRCIHAYFEEWKFKHPQPEDMRAVFERESGKDLGWVFDGLIGTTKKFDPVLTKLNETTLHYRLRGGVLAPFPVSLTEYDVPAQDGGLLWIEPKAEMGNIKLAEGLWNKAQIDTAQHTLDIDRRNNEVRSHGLFKRYKAPAFEPFLGIERDDRRSVYYAPAIAWNGHDGFQAGLVLHNTTFPSQRTEWVLAPLYAFGSERVVGGARIEHHFDRIRSRVFQNIHVGLSGRSASTFHDHYQNAWYTKVQPSVTFDFKRDPLTRPWEHSVTMRGVFLHNESVDETPDMPRTTSSSQDDYAELCYTAKNRRALMPTGITPVFTYNADFMRISLDVSQGFTYNERKDQLRIRAFLGTFLSTTDQGLSNSVQAWGLSWGPEDMLFDQAYLERGATDGFTGRQFTKQQGAFKTPFLQGGSDTWIASFNTEFDLPIGLPLSLFASAGFVPVTSVTQEGKSVSTASYMEAGIGIQVVRDMLEIWFPLVVSQRIADEEEFQDRQVTDRVRFVFALERMDPTKILRGLKP
jgi:hypothetical protein